MSDLEKVKLRKEEKVTFCLGEGNHDKCFFFLNIYIPKSSKGPDDQPKKINQKNQKKITLSKHHTTQFCKFYIVPDDQPKKINQKKSTKKNQPKKSKKNHLI